MNQQLIFYLSSIAILILGITAISVTVNRNTDCHYRKETWIAIGTYLIASGIFRIISQIVNMDQTLSREITGIMAFFVVIGTIVTNIHHFLFHWFLNKAGVIVDPK